jgi:ribosomal protein S18 acetylase RimI-like enzyme
MAAKRKRIGVGIRTAEVFYQGMRNMMPDDITSGLRLCRWAGWNQVAEDWVTFLQLSPGACRVVERNGAVVGTVATLRFGEAFSWIAMILVDPVMRGQGIGTELIREALTILKDEKCIRLDATEAGARIYRRHGFEEEYRLNRLVAKAPTTPACPEEGLCRPIRRGDLEEIFDLDKRVFGADRRELLLSFLARAPEYAWVARSGLALDGYVFGRHGHHHEQIGPLVAISETTALKLVSRCLARRSAESFLIDAPDDRRGFLQSAGFELERPLIRMYRGSRIRPEYERYQFGIAGPEFG